MARWTWLAAAALIATAPVVQAQAPAPPIVRTEGLKSISPHVQVIPDNSVPAVPNVGYVVGTKSVLVIDTGLGPKNGALVAETAQKIAPGRQIYLVTTHAHPEHDLGAQAFPAFAKLIRSKAQQADIAEQGLSLAKVFAARSPAMAELLAGAEFRPADISFEEAYDLDLGGVTVQILALGPNHTAGDTAVWVPADKVLFSGDVAMKAQPAMMSPKTSMAQWLASQDRFEALKPAIVVPSHGPIGDVGLVQGYRAYVTEVRDRTNKAKSEGLSLEAATAQVAEAMAARYPDRGRLAGAVKVAYAGT